MRDLSSSLCKHQYTNARKMWKVDLEVHAQWQGCNLTESPATGTAFVPGVLKETQTGRGCVRSKIGAGENSGKEIRSVNVASLYFQQLEWNIMGVLINLTLWTVLKAEIARSSLDCADNVISVCNLERFWPWCDWCDLIGVNHSFFISVFLCWDSLYEWWTGTLELIFLFTPLGIELILLMILHIGNPTDTRCSDYSVFSILTAWVFIKINYLEERHLAVYPSYLLFSERLRISIMNALLFDYPGHI